MIINIRGTSGSGKSTLVRRVLSELLLTKPNADFLVGRKQPLLYRGIPRDGRGTLTIMGHYETPCGGTDTIQNLDLIAEWVDREARHGNHVLFEGLLWSAETKRTIQLATAHPLVVVHLDVPLELCLASVNERRRAKDPSKEDVNPKNTKSKHTGTKSCMRKLAGAGVDTYACATRESAFEIVRDFINGRAVLRTRPRALPDQAAAGAGAAPV